MSERVLYTEEGDEVKVPGEETIAELQKQQEFVDSLKKDLEIGDGEDLQEKIKELKEGVNPHWGETRKQIKMLEKTIEVLKAQGKTIDENGNIVDHKGQDIEEMKKAAREEARKELILDRIEDSLDVYDEEEKKVINHYFKKLTAGEELTVKNVEEFIDKAIKASGLGVKQVDEAKRSINRIGSKSSGGSGGNKSFAESDTGKNLLKMMNINIDDKK
jgi:hypothetical protein